MDDSKHQKGIDILLDAMKNPRVEFAKNFKQQLLSPATADNAIERLLTTAKKEFSSL